MFGGDYKPMEQLFTISSFSQNGNGKINKSAMVITRWMS